MEITVRVQVRYRAPENNSVRDLLQTFRTPHWVEFMKRYIAPRLRSSSPAEPAVLQKLSSAWRVDSCCANCAICMNGSASPTSAPFEVNSTVELPCGHQFHHDCIYTWLQNRSTCPMCRYQFPPAFSGTFALLHLQSTLVPLNAHAALAPTELSSASVANETVVALARATLLQVPAEEPPREYECKVSARVMDGHGHDYSEADVTGEPDQPTKHIITAFSVLQPSPSVRTIARSRATSETEHKRALDASESARAKKHARRHESSALV